MWCSNFINLILFTLNVFPWGWYLFTALIACTDLTNNEDAFCFRGFNIHYFWSWALMYNILPSCVMSCHTILSYVMSCHDMKFNSVCCHIVSSLEHLCYIILCHVPFHGALSHVISIHIISWLMPWHILSCHTMWCYRISCHVTCHVMLVHFMSCHVILCHIMSYHQM